MMDQLLLGAAIPFIIAALVYVCRRGRAGILMLILTPIAMGCSAIWAVVPDIPRLLGMHELYMRLSFDPRINIFWWHYMIDQWEVDSPWYAVGIVLLAVALFVAALHELARAERN